MRQTALIVDDEPFVRADLRQLLRAHPEVEVVGEAGTVAAARELIRRTEPTVVFLDIQLRGGSGFELVEELGPQTAIVFVTASDRHAVRAFEVNALDYLVKPVSAARLAESLARLARPRAAGPLPAFGEDDRIFVKHDAGQRFVAVADVVVIASVGNYSVLELRDGKQLVVRRSLNEWEASLPSTLRRVNRGAIANLGFVEGLERDGEGLALRLKGRQEPLQVSRRRAAELRASLGALAGDLE